MEERIFEFDRIILVVRNPFDALESMFNLYLTNSHNKSIENDEYRRLAQEWEGFINDIIPEWNRFHDYWYNYALLNNVPFYIVRYEDLLSDTKNQLMSLLKFLLNYQQLEGTEIERRVDNYLQN